MLSQRALFTVPELLRSWMDLCGRYNIPAASSSRWFDAIVTRYSEPTRHYHTMQHVMELRTLMCDVHEHLVYPDAVEFTIFFHDLIYDPTRGDNEEMSALEFQRFVNEHDPRCITVPTEERVVGYIRQTQHHLSCPATAESDLLYFLDMDLAVLGSARERYVDYMRAVRQEYCHYSHLDYRKGRTRVLEGFLASPVPLYRTVYFKGMYDARAKHNVKFEIETLRLPKTKARKLTIGDAADVLAFEQRNRKDAELRLSEEQVKHALALNFELCLSFRDEATSEIIAEVVTTRGASSSMSLEDRTAHDFAGTYLLIHSLTVQRDRRLCGLGTAILKELVSAAALEGEVTRVVVWTTAQFQPFFEKHGFGTMREVTATTTSNAPRGGSPPQGAEGGEGGVDGATASPETNAEATQEEATTTDDGARDAETPAAVVPPVVAVDDDEAATPNTNDDAPQQQQTATPNAATGAHSSHHRTTKNAASAGGGSINMSMEGSANQPPQQVFEMMLELREDSLTL